KIRGFRIELGEIDKWVSEHPLCQENVTLLRRDKDEEPVLVTYLVPNLKQWRTWLDERGLREEAEDDESMSGLLKRFQALRADLRDYLKTKLPTYAVPTFFLPLRRMPLNPNGKIDKPALPFPNMAEITAASLREPSVNGEVSFSDTEKTIAEIWARVIPNTTIDTIRPDDSFFDIGGNSISAQYMLAAVKKRLPEVNVDIVTIIQKPMLRAFAAEVDRSLDPIGLRLDVNGQANGMPQEQAYSTDVDESFEKELQWTYPSTEPDLSHGATIFLTGVTGFLGAYILKDLLSRVNTRVIAHVRAPTEAAALKRIRETCQAYGIWTDGWLKRLSCVVGDLAKPHLGLDKYAWEKVANEANIVIHNGAKVHWVLPFRFSDSIVVANRFTYLPLTDDALKPTNVLSTIAAMSLCRNPSKPKYFCFISSTSVLDTDHYIQLCSSGTPVPENDELEGSRKGLGTGYGQSKWVSEHLVRKAGKRGLRGCIVRPGYVTGDTKNGVTNTDDFLVRHLKGCIQLGSAPIIPNGINMVPVNHVARCVVACAFHPPSSTNSTSTISVAQVTANPRLTFTQFTDVLKVYGYAVDSVPYEEWKR
ncbi:MAG: hypothetical protein Q9204_008111, partial [Flavoplaca sp. TL-2023a]